MAKFFGKKWWKKRVRQQFRVEKGSARILLYAVGGFAVGGPAGAVAGGGFAISKEIQSLTKNAPRPLPRIPAPPTAPDEESLRRLASQRASARRSTRRSFTGIDPLTTAGVLRPAGGLSRGTI